MACSRASINEHMYMLHQTKASARFFAKLLMLLHICTVALHPHAMYHCLWLPQPTSAHTELCSRHACGRFQLMQPEIATSSHGCWLRHSAAAKVKKCCDLTLRLRYLRLLTGTPPQQLPPLLHAAGQHRRQRILARLVCRAGHARGGDLQGVSRLHL